MAEKSDKAKGEKRFDIEEDLSKVEIPTFCRCCRCAAS